MASLGSLFSGIGINFKSGGGGFLSTVVLMIIGGVVLLLCIFGVWYMTVRRKNWNIKVEFRIPRNIKMVNDETYGERVEGSLNKEWGKGYYDAKRGVVFIKRKGKKSIPMKPFDVKAFLSTGNILTVVQVGIEDYRPIVDDSYIELIDDKTGEEAALLRAKIDTSESKSWKNTFERESKQAFSIKNWIQEHGGLIAMGLVLLMNLVGFAIVISRMPK